jgi:hypothetical protein
MNMSLTKYRAQVGYTRDGPKLVIRAPPTGAQAERSFRF